MTRTISFFCVSLLVLVLCGAAVGQWKDYTARGPDYALLNDIRLELSKIESAGTRHMSVEGHVIEAAAFKVVSSEVVPFLERKNPYNNVMKDLEIHYELLIGVDRQNLVHDKLISILKEISELPAGERDFSGVGLNGAKGKYLIYSGPASMPNYVWFDGRVVVVRFVKLAERRSDRPFNTESFWKQKIRFYPAGEKLSPSSVSKTFASDFLKRYAEREFERPK